MTRTSPWLSPLDRLIPPASLQTCRARCALPRTPAPLRTRCPAVLHHGHQPEPHAGRARPYGQEGPCPRGAMRRGAVRRGPVQRNSTDTRHCPATSPANMTYPSLLACSGDQIEVVVWQQGTFWKGFQIGKCFVVRRGGAATASSAWPAACTAVYAVSKPGAASAGLRPQYCCTELREPDGVVSPSALAGPAGHQEDRGGRVVQGVAQPWLT